MYKYDVIKMYEMYIHFQFYLYIINLLLLISIKIYISIPLKKNKFNLKNVLKNLLIIRSIIKKFKKN